MMKYSHVTKCVNFRFVIPWTQQYKNTKLNGLLNFLIYKLFFRWTFHLYDLNGDGVITRDEMEDVTASVDSSFHLGISC